MQTPTPVFLPGQLCFLFEGRGLSHKMLLYFSAASAEADDHVIPFHKNIQVSYAKEAEMQCYALTDMKS